MLTDRPLCRLRFTAALLPRVLRDVEQAAARAGLDGPRRGEFLVAVDAVAVNACEHAGGHGRLTLRRRGSGPHAELECRIEDDGPGFTEDVIPGLAPGLDGASAGRGLWLARFVTDRLTVTPLGVDGTSGTLVTLAVRLHNTGAPGPGWGARRGPSGCP